MSMTDPISDFLTRLRNGCQARHDKIELPHSKIKEALARVLIQEGYVRDCVVSGSGAERKLTVILRYTDDGRSTIGGIRRASSPPSGRSTLITSAPMSANIIEQ